jgi:peptidoglycan/xylan/chitin deacetylase (PgdA/CDA1 family)
MKKHLIPFCFLLISIAGCTTRAQIAGRTEITPWQSGKKGAVSITFDDGSRHQFSSALPILEALKLPATFFIITGAVAGSVYPGKFIGRPVTGIINESAHVPTDAANFFERASAARYLGYKGTLAYYNRADACYESGKKKEAYRVMDTLYNKARAGVLGRGKDTSMEISGEKGLDWDAVRGYAAKGYEFASHTVTHAHLAVLDSPNMRYELTASRDDIAKHLGKRYTFSAEVPFGIDDPRVMKTALKVYPALRNLMTDTFLKEINRGNPAKPVTLTKAYVQWQRGPVTETPLPRMKSWIDTTLSHDNIWLVLVFHGVDSLGWEPLSHERLSAYFHYLKRRQDDLWIATFGDVARYIRERMNAKLHETRKGGRLVITLTNSLDTGMYNMPLTLKTYLSGSYPKKITVKQGSVQKEVPVKKDSRGAFVLYQAFANKDPIELTAPQ